ncbi:AAA family ATPase [Xenorhabdus griffiniae]|uniref:endopeptidase La n=1 Tax=Xenorhabdus griffiniae TaxID=351672 RepID=A0ABY9XDM9_9GAMM|nr:Lon protease family protein [Xenorhabdus griffiniae]MBD1227355.1 Lon protease family protein [Xenorhabdus griffiniae]MBE8587548.1 Lon protease family protein [Xenorhabdus griffiniae]WMV71015.1 Lon protease family protein [Xenorhabdus griffiniae]WNH00691.1 Lon protease family protein [Xenorhabdus griffiniae]
MTNIKLDWQALQPNNAPYQALFNSIAELVPITVDVVQPRLHSGLSLFCQASLRQPFMLLKAEESDVYLSLLSNTVSSLLPENRPNIGGYYQIEHQTITWHASGEGIFAPTERVAYREWIEPEQLFGNVYTHQGILQLQPGLIHQVNGGILILPLRTLLSQPLMWVRLKQMIIQRRFDWLSHDENRSLPLPIPSMELDLRLILVGDRLSLEELQAIEPELASSALYGEFELDMPFHAEDDLTRWCQYVNGIIQQQNLPPLSSDAWPELIKLATRYTEDQFRLPLDLQWIQQKLAAAANYQQEKQISKHSLQQAEDNRIWRHSYLAERSIDEMLKGQILIHTQGSVIGQINGLSVLEYPGHPDPIGEPSRISCVAHLGDGEFTDVERKVELGGNIHAKGMMIMQAYLISELKLEQPQPFSASIVFEQSYGEVDGDSASLAELCALISALSQQPIDQQIAVTGAVDQFGYVQPIGGVNEKIEGFFRICHYRGLTGHQGVIIPTANVQHLCLNQDVIDAVKNEQFHIWAVEHVSETISLLTGIPYYDPQKEHLLAIIRERITQANIQERPRLPWFLRWLD